MASKQSMVQVSGTTYRIRSMGDGYHVFRVSDDRKVGAFQHRRTLRLLESAIDAEEMLEVARAALRQGRLDWTVPKLLSHPDLPARQAARPRRRGVARILANVLLVLGPSA